MSTETLTRPQVGDPALQDGEPRVAHIVKRREIAEAYIEGTPLEALCGHVWVPSRDPKKYPVCEACKEIASAAWGDNRDWES